MKTIIGSAIGILAIGLILIGFGLRGSAASNAPAGLASYAAAPTSMLPVADTGTRTTAAGPVMVNCGPGQRALVRQVVLNGEAVSQVACVADAIAMDATANYAAPAARPVSYSTSNGFRSARTGDITERRVVYQQPTQRVTVQKERSWKKPLLIIGGSTAAGAGIGGLVGGKKGALIGAALGGGASTIYQATRK